MRIPGVLLLAPLALLLGGCSLPSLLIQPVSSSPALEETVVEAGKTRREKVAVIEVEGLIANTRAGSGGLLGAEENPVSKFKQQLDAAAADRRVKAVVLRMNTPGGTVAASDLVYSLIQDFKARTGKPVIAACQTVCASGGYYVACAADEIHAAPTSLVGSIGVILELPDASQLLDKIGVKFTAIKSGPLKDLGSPFKPLGDDDRAVLQGTVDEFYARFTGVVKAARTVKDEKTAFDGRVFTGEGAKEMGLVDRVCQLTESIDRARELAKSPGARVVMYRRPYGYQGSIYAGSEDLTPRAESHEASAQLAAALAKLPIVADVSRMTRPGFYYLWRP